MFILRQIDKFGLESNLSLGNQYTVIDREHNENRFIDITKRLGEFPEKKNCHSVLTYGTGEYPLYTDQQYYVMTESGKTFDNLTYR